MKGSGTVASQLFQTEIIRRKNLPLCNEWSVAGQKFSDKSALHLEKLILTTLFRVIPNSQMLKWSQNTFDHSST